MIQDLYVGSPQRRPALNRFRFGPRHSMTLWEEASEACRSHRWISSINIGHMPQPADGVRPPRRSTTKLLGSHPAAGPLPKSGQRAAKAPSIVRFSVTSLSETCQNGQLLFWALFVPDSIIAEYLESSHFELSE